MSEKQPVPDCLIVGAGICGLTLATQLKLGNVTSHILEKSAGVGGRMATRRDGDVRFDHGAQFYKHSSARPFLWHQRWAEHQVTEKWFDNQNSSSFRGRFGMNSLAKDLAQHQNLTVNERVISIASDQDLASVTCESGFTTTARCIVLTCPLPQSLEILKTSKVDYPIALNDVGYAKALVGLFIITNDVKVPIPIGYSDGADSIFSIAVNSIGGDRGESTITVVMEANFSAAYFDKDEGDVMSAIADALCSALPVDITIVKGQLKRWRYSHPLAVYSAEMLALAGGRVVLAGDGFGGGSLHGAVRSALAVEKYLHDLNRVSVPVRSSKIVTRGENEN